MENKQKMTIDRLLEFMQYKDLNDNKITRLAGLSVGLIGKARRKKTGLHTDTIEKILSTFPELNPTWLLTGKGQMLLNEKHTAGNADINVNPKNTGDSLINEIFATQREVVALLKKKYHKD
ncbi:MAG: hypothetical protein LBQ84_09035 [Flavobacteriaceae bacterium]|jgi:hypothetical protein|nr:hypothetical protein [Flavobacteriaceae bacterium]